MDHHRPNVPAPDGVSQNWLEVVRRYVESLQIGAVEIIVHDSRVVQVEKTERLRFNKGGAVQTSEPLNAESESENGASEEPAPQ